MKRRKLALASVTAALLAAGALSTVAAADGATPPTDPAWINPDGSVNVEKMPTDMPIVDSKGRTIPGKTFNMKADFEASRPKGGPKPPSAAELKAEEDRGVKRIKHADGSEEVIEPVE